LIHKIEVASCIQNLNWIVDQQKQLLTKLCQHTITGKDIDEDWAIAELKSAGWNAASARRLARNKDAINNLNKPLWEHMQALANLSANVKDALLNAFDSDQKLFDALSDRTLRPYLLKWPLDEINAVQSKRVRGFFEAFYAPNFYQENGYEIPQTPSGYLHFHKEIFLSDFKATNKKLRVCSYCDGARDDEVVDHFYPKTLYPFYSCHPYNLVPICNKCNRFGQKGDRLPMSHANPDPIEEWFHPYYCTLHDWGSASRIPTEHEFHIKIENATGKITLELLSQNSDTQKRLTNLNALVKIQRRWKNALEDVIFRIQSKITGYVIEEQPFHTMEDLRAKLCDWMRDTKYEIGGGPHYILEYYYYKAVLEPNSSLFDDLWMHAQKHIPRQPD
jgi:hypothetical protein